MSVNISRLPILPVIEITKNDASTYTFNPFTSTFDFKVRSLSLKPPSDGLGGSFKLGFHGAAATHTQLNTIFSNIEEGNEILFYLGKTDADKQKIMRGVIESLGDDYVNLNFRDPFIDGPDWGSDILQWRIVNGAWHQDREADGITIDSTDLSTLIKQLVTNLFTDTQAYPLNDITVEDQGIVVNSANINPPDISIADFECNLEYLEDKLKELDEYGGTIHYVDPDKNFKMEHPGAASSPLPADILLTDDYADSVALSWDQSKVGLIKPRFQRKNTVEAHYARLLGLGGNQQLLNPESTTNSAGVQLETNYLAQKFTPTYRVCEYIGVYVKKVGSPTLNMIVELWEDNGGEPTGSLLKVLSISKDAITTGGEWHYLSIGEELSTSTSYWIVIRKTGDASNTYEWRHDNGSSGTNAYSSDGLNWTVQTSSYIFMHRIYSSSPLLSTIPGTILATQKHFHEAVIRKPGIRTREVMQKYLTGVASRAFKRKKVLSGVVRAPDTLLISGQKVRIRIQQSGFAIDDEFILGPVEYVFGASEEQTLGMYYYNISAVKYASY